MDFERYGTSAYDYWDRSRSILGAFEQSRHQLFYAAYELRCAIESFLFDYLVFLRDGDLSAKLRKLYLAKDLKVEILNIDPHFTKRIEFENLVHQAMGLIVINIPTPDLTRLGELYGKIGAYMHIQKSNMDTAQWQALEQLVKDGQTFLHDLVHPQKTRLKLTDEGLQLFEEFRLQKRDLAAIASQIGQDPTRYVSEATLVF